MEPEKRLNRRRKHLQGADIYESKFAVPYIRKSGVSVQRHQQQLLPHLHNQGAKRIKSGKDQHGQIARLSVKNEAQLLKHHSLACERKNEILQENLVGYSQNASPHKEPLQSPLVETKREPLKKTQERCKLLFTAIAAQTDEDTMETLRGIQEVYREVGLELELCGPNGEVGFVGRFDPFVLLGEVKEISDVDLFTFSVLPVSKHLEKDGAHSCFTKKSLQQVLGNLRCQNVLLDAELEQAKYRLGSKQHVSQECEKMEWKLDMSAVLPIDCIAHIISFTSPLDACRLSLVCHAFCAAAKLDTAWERFLPSDYCDNLYTNSSSSTKEKFYYFCRNPVLLEDLHPSMQSSVVDKRTGKKCLVIPNRYLRTRVSGKTVLKEKLKLGSMGQFETKLLSPKTTYVAYLVFKVYELSWGFDRGLVELLVHHKGGGSRGSRIVFLEPPEEDMDGVPRKREDGWTEIVMGEFFNDYAGSGATIWWCVRKAAQDGVLFYGLYIKGMEFRPSVSDIP